MNQTNTSFEQLNGKRLLLHSCCAPCSGVIISDLKSADIDLTIFFYNPNIHPFSEYEKRKQENKNYAHTMKVPFIDFDYSNKTKWFELTTGLEDEPERGKRCTVCFDFRLQCTAQYASAHGFDWFATTLGISRHKDLEQVNQSGLRAVQKYPQVNFFDYNWRINGGLQRSEAISFDQKFYRQQYCGCIFSLMDANHYRKKKGRPLIRVRP